MVVSLDIFKKTPHLFCNEQITVKIEDFTCKLFNVEIYSYFLYYSFAESLVVSNIPMVSLTNGPN